MRLFKVQWYHDEKKEYVMMKWEIRNKETGEVVGTEGCPGNAAELEMVLSEMNPDKTFTIVKVFTGDIRGVSFTRMEVE